MQGAVCFLEQRACGTCERLKIHRPFGSDVTHEQAQDMASKDHERDVLPFSSSQKSARAMALLKILVAGWLLPSRGDGPLETSSSTSTTPDPASISDASVCNPYRGYSYISIGAAGGIGSSQCTASWDLYEVEVRTSNGQVSALTAWSPTGSDSGHPPSEAVDGDLNSFWAGDHDLGMSLAGS